MKYKKLITILFLLFFTPFFAESIASTNTPWFMFFNPTILLLMALLYGTTALVLRELWVRGRLGFGHFLLYGAMFAGLNEGIVADTWFKFNPLNFKGQELARAIGTNWHMVINLITYHTLFSILIPILLSFLIFPQFNRVKLLSRSWLTICIGLLLLVAIGNLAPKNHMAVADHSQRLSLLVLLIIGAIVGAIIAHKPKQISTVIHYSYVKLLVIGTSFSILFTISYFILPKILPGWSLLFSVVLYLGGAIWASRIAKSVMQNLNDVLPLIGGLLSLSLVFSFTKISMLQPVVSGAFLVFIYWLHGRRKNPVPIVL